MADAADVHNIIDVLLQCGECNDIFEQVEMFQGHPCFDKNNNSCESTPEVKRKKKSPAASSSSWSCWDPVGPCSASCGNGTQLKVRECNSPAPTDGGLYCPGYKYTKELCNIRDCPVFRWSYLKEQNLTKWQLQETLKEEINDIKENLTLNSKQMSSAIRRRTSVRDDRSSAASCGYVGIGILSVVAVLMICSDCSRFLKRKTQVSATMPIAKVKTTETNNMQIIPD